MFWYIHIILKEMFQNETLHKSTQVPSLPTIGEGYGTTTQTIGTRMRKYSESVGRSYVASSVARWVTWFDKIYRVSQLKQSSQINSNNQF